MESKTQDKKVEKSQIYYPWIANIKVLSMFYIIFFHWYTAYFININPYRNLISQISHTVYVMSFAEPVIVFLGALPRIGYQAVGVFFLMSGMGLTFSIKNSPGWKDFFIRRFTRIYFPYWIAIVITFMIFYLAKIMEINLSTPVIRLDHSLPEWFLIFTLTNDLLPSLATFFNGTWWFLNVIILFYLSFPFFYALLKKHPQFIFLLLGLSIYIRRFYYELQLDILPYPAIVFTLRFIEFCLGIYIAIIIMENKDSAMKILRYGSYAGVIIWFFGGYAQLTGSYYAISDTMTTLGLFLTLYLIVNIHELIPKILKPISPIFYESYLIHYAIISLVLIIKPPFIWGTLLFFCIVFLSSWIMRLINKNIVILKSRVVFLQK